MNGYLVVLTCLLGKALPTSLVVALALHYSPSGLWCGVSVLY